MTELEATKMLSDVAKPAYQAGHVFGFFQGLLVGILLGASILGLYL